MLKVGITGGIGSGKTLVCSIFKSLGIPIYQADIEAKNLYFSNPQLKQELIQHFGEEFYLSPTEINKSLARNLLQNKVSRDLFNSIVHPKVFEHFDQWVSQQSSSYVIKEAAILFESGANKTVHLVVGVIAPNELRLQRVMKRDNLTESQVRNMMSLQLSNTVLEEKCDFIIQNNEQNSLINQVLKIHQELLNKSIHF